MANFISSLCVDSFAAQAMAKVKQNEAKARKVAMAETISTRLDAFAAQLAGDMPALRAQPDGTTWIPQRDPCDPTLEFDVRLEIWTLPNGMRQASVEAYVPHGHRMIDLNEPPNG